MHHTPSSYPNQSTQSQDLSHIKLYQIRLNLNPEKSDVPNLEVHRELKKSRIDDTEVLSSVTEYLPFYCHLLHYLTLQVFLFHYFWLALAIIWFDPGEIPKINTNCDRKRKKTKQAKRPLLNFYSRSPKLWLLSIPGKDEDYEASIT